MKEISEGPNCLDFGPDCPNPGPALRVPGASPQPGREAGDPLPGRPGPRVVSSITGEFQNVSMVAVTILVLEALIRGPG